VVGQLSEAVPRRDRSEWLADPAQPAARYRYLVEIEGVPPESEPARTALRQIPRRGWAADILRKQDPGGFWVHRKTLYRPKYVATNWRLLALADLGLTVRHPGVRRGVDLMLEDYGGSDGPFSRRGGEPHFFLVGLETLVHLGYEDDARLKPARALLKREMRPDGTWSADAVHPDLARGSNYSREPGTRPFVLERMRAPSRWITLRALKVLGED